MAVCTCESCAIRFGQVMYTYIFLASSYHHKSDQAVLFLPLCIVRGIFLQQAIANNCNIIPLFSYSYQNNFASYKINAICTYYMYRLQHL